MGAHETRVAVVAAQGGETVYAMYEATDLTGDGFFLAGPLFLEVDEEFTVELSPTSDWSLRTRVRVERVEQGDKPGMAVKFSGLSAPERKKLEGVLAADT